MEPFDGTAFWQKNQGKVSYVNLIGDRPLVTRKEPHKVEYLQKILDDKTALLEFRKEGLVIAFVLTRDRFTAYFCKKGGKNPRRLEVDYSVYSKYGLMGGFRALTDAGKRVKPETLTLHFWENPKITALPLDLLGTIVRGTYNQPLRGRYSNGLEVRH